MNHPDKGLFNSSITRVRPVFWQLIERDSTGLSWLSELLKLAPLNRNLALRLGKNPGSLLRETLKRRPYKDRVLQGYGLPTVDLEECFEKPFPPPHRFLRWLIENPDRMKWPGGRFGKETQEKREKLFGRVGVNAAKEVRQEALEELERFGPSRSARKWWAFEGFTEVDCCLETDRLLLFVEGKRKESLAPATRWYPWRNQLVRNLEVAEEATKDKDREFAVIVIAETGIDPIPDETVTRSLPHFTPDERKAVMEHFLGCILWSDLCESAGIDFTRLPCTTPDAVRLLT